MVLMYSVLNLMLFTFLKTTELLTITGFVIEFSVVKRYEKRCMSDNALVIALDKTGFRVVVLTALLLLANAFIILILAQRYLPLELANLVLLELITYLSSLGI